MVSNPWWTEADEAELDLLVWELVGAFLAHRDGCPSCAARDGCPALEDALEAVLEWRAGRTLRSKAAWLRERQTDHEATVAA